MYKFEYEQEPHKKQPTVRFKKWVGVAVPAHRKEEMVADLLNRMRANPDEGFMYTWTGDTLVAVFRHEDLIEVAIAQVQMTADVEVSDG